MLYCPTCRQGYEDGTERCPQCHEALVDDTFQTPCPFCGQENRINRTFCWKCGHFFVGPAGPEKADKSLLTALHPATSEPRPAEVPRSRQCPHCGEEMVFGQFRVGEGGAWACRSEATWWDTLWARNRRRVSDQSMKVCWHCGLMILVVEDPSLFRPKTDTDTLPRPASAPTPSPETLPRPAGTPEPDTETLPRPAGEK